MIRKSPLLKRKMYGQKGFQRLRGINTFPMIKLDRYYMRKALDQAKKAAAEGEVPVGAVLVYGGRTLTGHNLVERERNGMAHAEIRLLERAAALYGRRLNQATLYVTLEPCPMCAGAIIHMRVGRLVFAAPDPERGAVISKFHIFDDPDNYHKVKVRAGILEKETGQMLRDFFRRRRLENKSL